MITRRLAGTDLALSVIGLGCWAMGGEAWGAVDESEAIRTIHAALDGGVSWLDTAPLYGGSDAIVARALRGRSAIIATKVGARVDGGRAISDLSATHITTDCEASLRRLSVETIDLLQVHWPCDRSTPLTESFAALMALRDAGKIRHIGVCNYGPEALAEIRAIAPVVSLQTPYSLLRRGFEQDGLAQAGEGLSVLAYEGLCRGLLTGKYTTPPRFPEHDIRSRDPRFSGAQFTAIARFAADLGRVGERVGASAAAVALGWVAARPGITAVIAGMRSPQQVADNLVAARLLPRRKLWDVVDRVAGRHGL
ncbi:MAG: aryl-alcohol dehydrogenase-like predicted oxidoreductase [Myxococcota bacterium]|jgi:aryl-alcohol dehydrogenase-like predicted oxidoreductase